MRRDEYYVDIVLNLMNKHKMKRYETVVVSNELDKFTVDNDKYSYLAYTEPGKREIVLNKTLLDKMKYNSVVGVIGHELMHQYQYDTDLLFRIKHYFFVLTVNFIKIVFSINFIRNTPLMHKVRDYLFEKNYRMSHNKKFIELCKKYHYPYGGGLR